MLGEFYRDKGKERGVIGKILLGWCPQEKHLLTSAKQIPGTEFAEVLKALAEERYSGEYSKNITYQRCMVHGDLGLDHGMGHLATLRPEKNERLPPIKVETKGRPHHP